MKITLKKEILFFRNKKAKSQRMRPNQRMRKSQMMTIKTTRKKTQPILRKKINLRIKKRIRMMRKSQLKIPSKTRKSQKKIPRKKINLMTRKKIRSRPMIQKKKNQNPLLKQLLLTTIKPLKLESQASTSQWKKKIQKKLTKLQKLTLTRT